MFVCGVFWDVAFLHLTITVHLKGEKKILLGFSECEQNNPYEVFGFIPHWGSQMMTVSPLVTISYCWKYEWNAKDTFCKVQCFLPFYFLTALSLPLALECIYKLILMCWAIVREFKAPVSSLHQQNSEYLSLMLYILRMNSCTPVWTDPFLLFKIKKKSVEKQLLVMYCLGLKIISVMA